MNQMHAPAPGSPLLDHCPETLAASCYLDPDWFARERTMIWARHWVYVGRFNDLPDMTMRRITVAGETPRLCGGSSSSV